MLARPNAYSVPVSKVSPEAETLRAQVPERQLLHSDCLAPSPGCPRLHPSNEVNQRLSISPEEVHVTGKEQDAVLMIWTVKVI